MSAERNPIPRSFHLTPDARLSSLENLQPRWDGEDAEVPNSYSMDLAGCVLTHLDERRIHPTAIMPCIDGGVSIAIHVEKQKILIECYNTKVLAVSLVSTDLQMNDNFSLTDPTEAEVSEGIQRIHDFLVI